MKEIVIKPEFIIFISIILLIYSGINFYIYNSLTKIPLKKHVSITAKIFFFILISSYPVSLIGALIKESPFWINFKLIGSYYLGLMFYLFLMLLVIDLFRFMDNATFKVIPKWQAKSNLSFSYHLFGVIIITLTTILLYGHYNASVPVVNSYNIKMTGYDSKLNHLKVAVVSDFHLGDISNYENMKNKIDKINNLQPDLILIPGDIIDRSASEIRGKGYRKLLKKLTAQYGVFASVGNHEYFSGLDKNIKFLRDSKISVLCDSLHCIDSLLYIAGRNDAASDRFGEKRKSLKKIVRDKKLELPLFLLDHTPHNLQEAADSKIDMQVSGHTHYGQLYPLNYIVNMIFELSWGHKKIDNTNYFVTCGIGTWGPPLRIGSRSEIILVNIDFTK